MLASPNANTKVAYKSFMYDVHIFSEGTIDVFKMLDDWCNTVDSGRRHYTFNSTRFPSLEVRCHFHLDLDLRDPRAVAWGLKSNLTRTYHHMVMSDYLISSSSCFSSTAANLGHTLWFTVGSGGASARQPNL